MDGFLLFVVICPLGGCPRGLSGKESACNAGYLGLIPGLGRSRGEGNGNALQSSCLENPRDRGAWRAAAHGVKQDLDMTERLDNGKPSWC